MEEVIDMLLPQIEEYTKKKVSVVLNDLGKNFYKPQEEYIASLEIEIASTENRLRALQM